MIEQLSSKYRQGHHLCHGYGSKTQVVTGCRGAFVGVPLHWLLTVVANSNRWRRSSGPAGDSQVHLNE